MTAADVLARLVAGMSLLRPHDPPYEPDAWDRRWAALYAAYVERTIGAQVQP